MTLTYKQSGVDIHTAENALNEFSGFLKSRPNDPRLLNGIGFFASCFALKDSISKLADPLLVTCCDGVGTKSKLALDWGFLLGLGQDLVAMNANDLICTGATPLVFLDYYACGSLQKSQLLTLLKSIQEGCELAECSLAGGETAEMPGLYQGEDFDLGGFSVGIVDRSQLLGAEKVKEGHVLIGIESSGIHSNGYSLVRQLIAARDLQPFEKAPFDQRNWREVLLAPTHIYVKALKPLLPSLSGLAHITGEGLFGNLPRILPTGTKGIIHSKSWHFPDLFSWLQRES
ncbi:MAG: phosphoribosylformylglycinamidine cyclo-ligase, partial [Proteobacteria bacterium]|nr:phosphoribosylformylglycinamidine cyclo-ligase [Pseudomonadota bacterium]